MTERNHFSDHHVDSEHDGKYDKFDTDLLNVFVFM